MSSFELGIMIESLQIMHRKITSKFDKIMLKIESLSDDLKKNQYTEKELESIQLKLKILRMDADRIWRVGMHVDMAYKAMQEEYKYQFADHTN